jgi:biopolymer transport protein TolQ
MQGKIRKGYFLGSVEFSVITLILNATFFTKCVLGVLLTFSIMSWAIMVHKYFFVRRYVADISRFLATLTGQGNPLTFEEACVRFSTGKAKALPIILLKLLRSVDQGKTAASPAGLLNTAVMREIAALQGGMGVLATAASVSPLLGLLGTVWGVMYSFLNIGNVGSASIAAVAPGIAEALMTTIGGLLVAIPAMAGHTLLSGYINRCLDSLDRISEFSLAAITRGYKS